MNRDNMNRDIRAAWVRWTSDRTDLEILDQVEQLTRGVWRRPDDQLTIDLLLDIVETRQTCEIPL